MQKLSDQAYKNKLNYIKNYGKEKYICKNLRIPKDTYEKIAVASAQMGITDTQFIKNAINEKLDNIDI